MKKLLAFMLTIALLLSFAACGNGADEDKNLADPDITIDQIAWSMEEGELDGDSYVLCKFTNKSQYTVTSLKLVFTGREGLTQEQLDQFYAAVQQSQGFGDAFMENFIQDRENKKLSISMYAQEDSEVSPGGSAKEIKCYYFGGFTSKNVIYPDLFTPESAMISYLKDGQTQTIGYDFASGEYSVVEMN